MAAPAEELVMRRQPSLRRNANQQARNNENCEG